MSLLADFPYYDRLFNALKRVKRPGDFATGGPATRLPLPALRVEGLPGQIGLPLTEAQAKAISEKSSQAPFGRGERTIVDTAVRRTWQLNPSQFVVGNPRWEPALRSLLGEISTALGCDAGLEVTCDLYKLLLYEPGGFFKRHRDTEKVDGMFGTLVVQLPSDYQGGQLEVCHLGKKQTFDFSGIEGSTGFHYAAFYADCQHELLPVTQGYRLCLVYNLIYRGPGKPPVPADNRKLVQQVVGSLTEWDADEGGPPMMAYLLEHQYCDASLSFQALKNTDRASAELLQLSQKEISFDLYLASVTKSETCSCSHYCYGCHGSGCTDYSVEEVDDQEFSASGWVAPTGKREDFGSIDLEEGVVVPPGFLDEADPDDEDFQEATGNEGATLERTYHCTALVLWPRRKRVAVLGWNRMTAQLEESIANLGGVPQNLQLAKDLISLSKTKKPSLPSAVLMLRILQVFHNPELTCEFLGNLSTSSSSQEPHSSYLGWGSSSSYMYVTNTEFCDQLLATCKCLGWEALQLCLCSFFESNATTNIEACCKLLLKFVGDAFPSNLDSKHQGACRQFASILCNTISKESDITAGNHSLTYSWSGYSRPSPRRSKDFVCQVFKILVILGCDAQLNSLLASFFKQPNRYPLLTVLVPASQELHSWLGRESSAQCMLLVTHCVKILEARTKVPLPAMPNWSMNISLGCSCPDCSQLQAFLKSPSEMQTNFKVIKSRRLHLHRQLDGHSRDVTHQTLRQGSPQTLVVTKTRSAFVLKQQQRKEEAEALARLNSLHFPEEGQPQPKRSKVVDLTSED